MNSVKGCAECHRLSESYEKATMAWFRLEGNLRIAEYGRDEESVLALVRELAATGEQRDSLRSAIARHQSETHPKASTASGHSRP